MAILDKQGLQHYANKMCNADNRKVGSKSLPTALNDIDTAIDGFKTLFESEYGSALDMKLENNKNVFSVGTGTNIDKSSEVENSFTDVELSGNSLVNLINFKDKIYTPKNNIFSVLSHDLKLNTIYTIIVIVTNNTLDTPVRFSAYSLGGGSGTATMGGTTITGDMDIISPKTTGVFVGSIGYKQFGSSNKTVTLFSQNATTGSYTASAILIEGDYTNKPLPQYFEGLKSIGEKEDGNHKISILSVGKNLLNIKDFKSVNTSSSNISVEYKENKIILTSNNTNSYTYTSVELNLEQVRGKSLKIYHNGVKVTNNTNQRIIQFNILKEDGSYSYLGSANNNTTVTIPVDSKKVSLCLYTNNSNTNNFSNTVEINELMICYADISQIPYEPHKSDKKEISLNEPLRGLPNGVKDTIEKINGEWKIVRRCGEIIFDGSENFSKAASNTKEHFFILLENLNGKAGHGQKLLCDRFCSYGAGWDSGAVPSVTTSNTHYLQIGFTFELNTYGDKVSFKNWLSQNPTKVVYELATPIIEDISPVTLQCWKNGTISIDEVIPVETTHTVALNKSAQIQKNIEELTILRNRVKALEEQYDKTALNQAYEVELLRLDMQLDNII